MKQKLPKKYLFYCAQCLLCLVEIHRIIGSNDKLNHINRMFIYMYIFFNKEIIKGYLQYGIGMSVVIDIAHFAVRNASMKPGALWI